MNELKFEFNNLNLIISYVGRGMFDWLLPGKNRNRDNASGGCPGYTQNDV